MLLNFRKIQKAIKKAFHLEASNKGKNLFNARRVEEELEKVDIYLTPTQVNYFTFKRLEHYRFTSYHSEHLRLFLNFTDNKEFNRVFMEPELSPINQYQFYSFCKDNKIILFDDFNWFTFMSIFMEAHVRKHHSEYFLNPVDFTTFTSTKECFESIEFVAFIIGLIEKYKGDNDPYINCWYDLYKALGENKDDADPTCLLSHEVAEELPYKRKDTTETETKTGKTETSVPTPQALLKTKKENTMSFNTPVTTEIRHLVNNENVKEMSKQQLFDAALELKQSIKNLKKAKLDSKAVNQEVKQQKRVLKTVVNYLDTKK